MSLCARAETKYSLLEITELSLLKIFQIKRTQLRGTKLLILLIRLRIQDATELTTPIRQTLLSPIIQQIQLQIRHPTRMIPLKIAPTPPIQT